MKTPRIVYGCPNNAFVMKRKCTLTKTNCFRKGCNRAYFLIPRDKAVIDENRSDGINIWLPKGK
jgi:hypothetical protein